MLQNLLLSCHFVSLTCRTRIRRQLYVYITKYIYFQSSQIVTTVHRQIYILRTREIHTIYLVFVHTHVVNWFFCQLLLLYLTVLETHFYLYWFHLWIVLDWHEIVNLKHILQYIVNSVLTQKIVIRRYLIIHKSMLGKHIFKHPIECLTQLFLAAFSLLTHYLLRSFQYIQRIPLYSKHLSTP